MQFISERLKGITHPLVSSVRFKKSVGNDSHFENVLVIDTRFPDEDDDIDTFDSYLMDLLQDLEGLKNEAEKQIGKFDRVDIRTH